LPPLTMMICLVTVLITMVKMGTRRRVGRLGSTPEP
jgi:hypothetical protein